MALVALVTTAYVGARAVGPLPPLGPLLDPANGIWATVQTAELPVLAEADIPGLRAPVDIAYDDRGVPHIFAESSDDAYRALGYVVARDRLFQIEMQTRAGAGTLTELVGERALPLDQTTRALGMPRAAEQRVATADTTAPSWRMGVAYAAGVNAWQRDLARRDIPLEYKLLGREPSPYAVIDMLHLSNRMGYTLAVSYDELQHAAAAAAIGQAAADGLFPVHSPLVEPIQPNGRQAMRTDRTTLPPPGAPDSSALSAVGTVGAETLRLALGVPPRGPDAIGSNNWAVAPQRSASGNALLAGDPHLELTLPSIWYEAHIVVADSMDVYGVTIPGLPGIVIGFNRDVAWTFTNVGADVMDFYVETVDDPTSPTQYRLDSDWQPLERREARYLNQRGALISADTLRYTHRGPLRKLNNQWMSHRWTVLEGDFTEAAAFNRAARARTSAEVLDIMAAGYHVPAQNMLAADRSGTIGIRSTGRYPIRPDTGRGDRLRDGTTRASDWIGDWAVGEYPQSLSPAQGYLASANQEPLDPEVQPRYLGTNWERPWRAARINTLLRENSAVTATDMARYQTDPRSERAAAFVPAFVRAARTGPPRPSLVSAGRHLGEWDLRYSVENQGAVLFEAAMRNLPPLLYDELRRDAAVEELAATPRDMQTAILLSDPESPWWDVRSTGDVETRDEILAEALELAYDELVAELGEPGDPKWAWSEHQTANVNHLLRLPSLSRQGLPVQGGNATLSPSTGGGTQGASWRMVVELGDEVAAAAIYPGGQSGNPVSERYDDRLAKWSSGQLDTLRVPRSLDQLRATGERAALRLMPRED